MFVQKKKDGKKMNSKEFKKAVDLLHEEKGIDKEISYGISTYSGIQKKL